MEDYIFIFFWSLWRGHPTAKTVEEPTWPKFKITITILKIKLKLKNHHQIVEDEYSKCRVYRVRDMGTFSKSRTKSSYSFFLFLFFPFCVCVCSVLYYYFLNESKRRISHMKQTSIIVLNSARERVSARNECSWHYND